MEQTTVYQRPEVVHSAQEALQLLKEGNQRYRSGSFLNQDRTDSKRQQLVEKGQKPLAVIVTCSDSRVPPEMIFDQGIGDLFVVRVAGNVLGPLTMGSVEYGVEHLHCPLLVVMGHNHCGAVKAAVEGGEAPGSIGAIVEKIKPAVQKAQTTGATGADLYKKAEDYNIEAVLADLKHSHIVEELIEKNELQIVGAKYCLETGAVEFF